MVEKSHGLVVEPVEIGRLDDGVAVTCDIAVALVIREDEDDVRRLCGIGTIYSEMKAKYNSERNRKTTQCSYSV